MFVRGLRAKIAITIAFLLFLAMFLIYFVTMVTTRRDLINSEIWRGEVLLSCLQERLAGRLGAGSRINSENSRAIISPIFTDSQITSALIMTENDQPVWAGSPASFSSDDLIRFTRETMSTQKKAIHFIGSTWGVFWREKSHLVLSTPLQIKGQTVGGFSIILPLEHIYQTLRSSQKILIIYIFVNIVILTFAGIYRISKLYLLPLSRLAERADDYKEDDDMIFTVRKEDNELSRLSKALNSMLKRISADKEKMRSTVQSLEQANQQLKKAQREIIRAEKLASAGRLSAGIAHEIGNPIGIVIGYLELLKQKDITTEEREEYIQRTEEEIDRINTIIRQLLEVSRPSNAGRQAVSVNELIHDTADVLRVQPLMSEIDLSLDLSASQDTVFADPNQLRQVFLNLTINAADAIAADEKERRGTLNIATRLETHGANHGKKDETLVKIMFVDNGPGIAEEHLGNIFDPFFTTKDPGKGTGLGLSVSFMIVESIGGRMTVNSEPGRGTTMEIILPLYRKGQLQ